MSLRWVSIARCAHRRTRDTRNSPWIRHNYSCSICCWRTLVENCHFIMSKTLFSTLSSGTFFLFLSKRSSDCAPLWNPTNAKAGSNNRSFLVLNSLYFSAIFGAPTKQMRVEFAWTLLSINFWAFFSDNGQQQNKYHWPIEHRRQTCRRIGGKCGSINQWFLPGQSVWFGGWEEDRASHGELKKGWTKANWFTFRMLTVWVPRTGAWISRYATTSIIQRMELVTQFEQFASVSRIIWAKTMELWCTH